MSTDVVTPQQTADDLEAAADLLERNGHVKGVLTDYQGRHCAVGALLNVVQDGRGCFNVFDVSVTPRLAGALDAVVQQLNLPMGTTSSAWDVVARWNNEDERTEVEVIEAFRHTAKDLRNEAVPA